MFVNRKCIRETISHTCTACHLIDPCSVPFHGGGKGTVKSQNNFPLWPLAYVIKVNKDLLFSFWLIVLIDTNPCNLA